MKQKNIHVLAEIKALFMSHHIKKKKIKNWISMLGVNPPPPLQLHASQAVHQSPQQGAPPLQFLYIKCVISEKTSMTAFHIDSKRIFVVFWFFFKKKEKKKKIIRAMEAM